MEVTRDPLLLLVGRTDAHPKTLKLLRGHSMAVVEDLKTVRFDSNDDLRRVGIVAVLD